MQKLLITGLMEEFLVRRDLSHEMVLIRAKTGFFYSISYSANSEDLRSSKLAETCSISSVQVTVLPLVYRKKILPKTLFI